MNERDELAALRRLAELEAKAGGVQQPQTAPQPNKEGSGFGGGLIHGALDPVFGISQLVPRGISYATSLGGNFPNKVSEFYAQDAQRMDQMTKQREREYQAGRAEPSKFDWGRLAGNMASPINLIGMGAVANTGRAVTAAGQAVKQAPMLASAAKGMATGAGFGASMPVTGDDYAKEKMAQIGWGAAGGAAAPYASRALEKVFNPKVADDVAGLIKQKIPVTVGQTLGGGFKRAEDALTSVPVLGDLIRSAQNRTFKALNTASINRALEPIGKKLPKGMIGREAIQYADDALGKEYDDLLPKLTGMVDDEFRQGMTVLRQMVDDDFVMNAAEKTKFAQIIKNTVENRVSKTGGITGQAIKQIESQIGDLSKKFGKSLNPSEQQLSDALAEAQDVLRQMVARSNPDHAQKLRAINEGWANFKRVQRAAASTGTDAGIFTPAQLQAAVKALDRSKDKARFAEGKALMQDLSEPAKAILPSKLNESGTAPRMLYSAGVLGGGAYGADQLGIDPKWALPLALLAPMYMPGGQQAAQALLTKRPQAVRQLGSQLANYAKYIAAPLAVPAPKNPGN